MAGLTDSAIYDGWVRHRRRSPRPHDLRYRIFQPYLDLGEATELLRPWPIASARWPALAWLRRRDHLAGSSSSLEVAVRDAIEAQLGERPKGPIRALAHLRMLGFAFNPVSFFYVFDEPGTRVQCIVAEVDNTPWGERHLYVLNRQSKHAPLCFEFDKKFHVSPFMPMKQRYRWTFSEPGQSLVVHMQTFEPDRLVFDATLSMRRTAWSRRALARRVLSVPWMTAKVFAAIYWNALRLWLKGVPFYEHPSAGTASASAPRKRTGFSASAASSCGDPRHSESPSTECDKPDPSLEVAP